jgi:GntR family negative regulator for fad regulon and positive regulator of fabA
MNWIPPLRPIEYAEQALVTAILEGAYLPGSILPGERDLAAQLGITRPTLREALGRLARDGWLTIQQGKPTLVRDFWRQGGLNVLSALARYSQELPPDFILNLLEVRLAMAPAYIRAAIERQPEAIAACLAGCAQLANTPEAYAAFDWQLHYQLTIASGNPIYTLILNGFVGFYEQMARRYFARPSARTASRDFYASLLSITQTSNAAEAENLARTVMQESIRLWQSSAESS